MKIKLGLCNIEFNTPAYQKIKSGLESGHFTLIDVRDAYLKGMLEPNFKHQDGSGRRFFDVKFEASHKASLQILKDCGMYSHNKAFNKLEHRYNSEEKQRYADYLIACLRTGKYAMHELDDRFQYLNETIEKTANIDIDAYSSKYISQMIDERSILAGILYSYYKSPKLKEMYEKYLSYELEQEEIER